MQCRRCGEENMPGLAACLGCGRALASAPEPVPPRLVPRVKTTNPLRAAPRRPAPPRRRGGAGRRGALLWAALTGLLPGLAAARRGQRRLAAWLVGATLLGLVLIPLTWGTTYSVWSGVLITSAVMTAAAAEVRARGLYPPPWGALSGAALALTAALGLRVVLLMALFQVRPQVLFPGAERLERGSYLTAPLRSVPAHDTLCAVEVPGRWGGVTVGPVLAVGGEVIERGENGALLVDGVPTEVQPVNDGIVRLPGAPLEVPAGHVVLYVEPLRSAPLDEVREITYRWAPALSRGPVTWPVELEAP